jgi:hypothetical protein
VSEQKFFQKKSVYQRTQLDQKRPCIRILQFEIDHVNQQPKETCQTTYRGLECERQPKIQSESRGQGFVHHGRRKYCSWSLWLQMSISVQ